jgi:hypothetical protein
MALAMTLATVLSQGSDEYRYQYLIVYLYVPVPSTDPCSA